MEFVDRLLRYMWHRRTEPCSSNHGTHVERWQGMPDANRSADVQQRRVPGALRSVVMGRVECVLQDLWWWRAEPWPDYHHACCIWRQRVPVSSGVAKLQCRCVPRELRRCNVEHVECVHGYVRYWRTEPQPSCRLWGTFWWKVLPAVVGRAGVQQRCLSSALRRLGLGRVDYLHQNVRHRRAVPQPQRRDACRTRRIRVSDAERIA